MKYKILFFSEILGAGGGGIASKRIIDSFKNHEIKVISITNEKNYYFIIKYNIIKFYFRLKRYFLTTSDKFKFNIFNPKIAIYTLANIKKKIDKFKPDIIIVTWIEFLISMKTLNELKNENNSEVIFIAMDNHLFTGGCRYVNECENFLKNCNNCFALKKNFQKISSYNYFYFRNYFKKIKPKFMLPSNYSKNFFKKTKLDLDFNFVEFNFWPIQIKKELGSLNFEKNINDKSIKIKTIICPIQKFSEPRKGWQYLYQSIIDFQNQLSDSEIKIKFILVGNLDDKHINSLKNLRVNYEYYNYLNRKNLEKLYIKSDFGIIPSVQEWASISTSEMMTFGLPVINFLTGSSKNIIVEGKNGFIVNLKNIYELSNKFLEINNMGNDQIKKMKLFTYRYSLENFESNKFEKKLTNLYEQTKVQNK